jgi:hypothetical protein
VDATTGYVLNILTYFGASTSYDPAADTDSGMAVTLFDTLLRHVGTGHHIFADRYYTTAALVRHLLEKKIYYTGTLNTNRKDFTPQLTTLCLKHMESRNFLDTGNKVLVTAFRDKKAKKHCVLVSTKATVADYTHPVKNKTKPLVINNYNHAMGGCDRVDQIITYYSNIARKSYKWWKKIFHWILEICQSNAFILFLLTRPRGTTKMSFKNFKLILKDEFVKAAAGLMSSEERNGGYDTMPKASNSVERLQGTKHLIRWAGADRNCVYCSTPAKRKRTSFICPGCTGSPFLCPKYCFERYHSPSHVLPSEK